MSYNAFEKPIGETLDELDLQGLVRRRVTEGYFVEFKRELPADRLKIARSIASFANTYGGWYIVGVTTDGHNVATDVPGFEPNDKQHDPTAVITEAMKVNVDPVPVFFAQVVTLATGRLASVVFVPGDQACPFITKDGRVYRRIHDSSDPIMEIGRHALDDLYARGKKVSEAFKEFSMEQRSEAGGMGRDSRICLFISPSPPGLINKPGVARQEAAAALIADSKKPRSLGEPFADIKGNVPLDTALTRLRSVVLRQVKRGHEHRPGFTVELDTLGRCKICVPISSSIFTELAAPKTQVVAKVLGEWVNGQLASEGSFGTVRFFNIGDVWVSVLALVSFYLDWLQPPAHIAGFDVAVEAIGIANHVPFYDSERWAEHVRAFGMPVTLRDHSRIPEFPEGVAWDLDAEALGLKLCVLLCAAVGLPIESFGAVTTSAIRDAYHRSHGTSEQDAKP